MGKDKLKRFAEIATFDHVLEPTWDDAIKGDYPLKGKWAKDFFKNDHPIVLELACGGGEYTVGLAQLYPNINFLGIDIKGNRIWKGAKFALENGLNNVGFVRTRIDFIENFFASGEVQDIWITFPDPQREKNRTRKRLTHPLFLNRYRKFLSTTGRIRLKTDSTFLYDFTKEVLQEEKITPLVDSNNIYEVLLPAQTGSALDQELAIKTYYEKRWLEEGKKIKYLEFNLITEH